MSDMKSHGGATAVSHHPKKLKSREVSPRFLSPASSTTSSSTDYGSHESPNSILSPIKQQRPRSSTDSRKPKTLKNSGFLRGLWPSSSVPSLPKKPDTLADFIGNEQRGELAERKVKKKSDQNPSILNRQRSCTEFSRFDNDRNNISSKENFNPIFGGSMRYTGKFKFPGKSKSSNLMESEDDILPGRFSIDEIAVRKNSYSRGLPDPDSGSEYSDGCPSFDAGKDSPASYMAPTVSSRKHRIDVPSRFMQDLSSRSRRWSGDPLDNYGNNSPKIFSLKKKGSGDWASSPARTGSPKVPLGEKEGKLTTMVNSKPPTSPSRGKGVGNILSLGIELLKGKKSTSSSSTSPLGPGSAENVHQLRLLHNNLTQWRFSNARAEVVDENIVKQAKIKSIHVWNALIKLQQSVLQKKLQLQKEKLEMKLDYIVHSQIKALEAWGNMERQHSSAVCSTTDYLHSVICMIPLVDGAKVEPQSASVVCRHASDLATKINMMITTFQPTVEKTVGVVAELAMVVIQEKQLLEECLDLFKYVSALEMEERSLRGSIMQLRLLEQQRLEIMA